MRQDQILNDVGLSYSLVSTSTLSKRSRIGGLEIATKTEFRSLGVGGELPVGTSKGSSNLGSIYPIQVSLSLCHI